MKRERDYNIMDDDNDDDDDEDDENPQSRPNRSSSSFRISPESTCSNHNPTTLPRTNNNNNNSATKSTGSHNNKEQDRFLPIANVGRIMKKVIPGNGKISKDAKETVQECVSEFISFVTGEASDKCQREKRKTINGDDILWAIMTLGFEDYVNPLKLYLTKYREIEGEKLNVPKQQRLQHDQTPNVVPNYNKNNLNTLHKMKNHTYPILTCTISIEKALISCKNPNKNYQTSIHSRKTHAAKLVRTITLEYGICSKSEECWN